MNGLTWEEPPPRNPGRPAVSRWDAAAVELKSHPGKWAKFGPYKAASSRSGAKKMLARNGEGFEVVSRKGPDGFHWLFARYAAVEAT